MPRKWGAACGAQAVSRKGERRVTRRIWSPGRPAAAPRWCCPAQVALRSKRRAAVWLIALVVDAGGRDRYERCKPDQDRPAFSIACGTIIGIEHRPGFAVCHIAWIGHGCVSQLEHNGGAPRGVPSEQARATPARAALFTLAGLTGLKPEVEVPTLRPFREFHREGDIIADPAPKTRNWRAIENAHKPKGLHVLVFGEVEVSATNKEPVLTEKPERDPKNLGLHLTIKESGAGGQMMVWKPAHFHKVVKANEYNDVIVRWYIDQIANFPIYDDREHEAKAAAALKTLNERHAGKGKAAKPTGKKPAAKKAATKTQEAAPKRSPRRKRSQPRPRKPRKRSRKKPQRKRQPRNPRSKRWWVGW